MPSIDRATFKKFQMMLYNVADKDFDSALARVHSELVRLGYGSNEITGQARMGAPAKNRQYLGGQDR